MSKEKRDTEASESAPAASASSATGYWECLNEPRNCKLAAPDPRTPPVLFEGPTQGGSPEGGPIVCPECKGEHVIYRGDKEETVAPTVVS